jgi:hypothetical protein
MRTIDPLDLPKAERPVLSESAEDAGYYFNARWYDAERGAFTGRDPKLQFWTPYSYVGNAPLTGFDPDGRQDYSSMTGMDFGGMADFALGQSTGYSADNLALNVNSALDYTANNTGDWASIGSSWTSYGAYGLAGAAGVSACFGQFELAIPLYAGAQALGTTSASLGITALGAHGIQAIAGDNVARAKLLPDFLNLAGGYASAKAGGAIAGRMGEFGGSAYWNAIFDGVNSPGSSSSGFSRKLAPVDNTFVSIPRGQ